MLCLHRDPRPGGSNKTAPKSDSSASKVKVLPKSLKTTANFKKMSFVENISVTIRMRKNCSVSVFTWWFLTFICNCPRIYFKFLNFWKLFKHDYLQWAENRDLLLDWTNITPTNRHLSLILRGTTMCPWGLVIGR